MTIFLARLRRWAHQMRYFYGEHQTRHNEPGPRGACRNRRPRGRR
jgi:hypothetical protein